MKVGGKAGWTKSRSTAFIRLIHRAKVNNGPLHNRIAVPMRACYRCGCRVHVQCASPYHPLMPSRLFDRSAFYIHRIRVVEMMHLTDV